VPALYGLDTRALTKMIREKGSILGKIVFDRVRSGSSSSSSSSSSSGNSNNKEEMGTAIVATGLLTSYITTYLVVVVMDISLPRWISWILTRQIWWPK